MSTLPLAFAAAAVVLAAPLAAQTPIRPGEVVNERLEEGDRRMRGAYYDAYVIRGQPGAYVLVQMRSRDFDTELHWGGFAQGEWMGERGNDDHGDGTDSRLVVRLGEPGEYELRTAAFGDREGGEYELRVTAVGGPSAGRIGPGETVHGRLEETDREGPEGYEDHYVIQGAPGDTVTIYVESDEFYSYAVFGPWRDGVLTFERPHGDGCGGPELVAVFEDSPVHHVMVGAGAGGERTGAYSLRVVAGAHPEPCEDEEWSAGLVPVDTLTIDTILTPALDIAAMVDTILWEDTAVTARWSADSLMWTTDSPEVADVAAETDSAVSRVYAGSRVEGRIDQGSPRDRDGFHYQEFAYTAYAGERLKVRLSSGQMDSYLLIGTGRDDGFQAMVEDDDGGPGRDAHITWTVPEAGEYTIRATTTTPGRTGSYVLRVRTTVRW
jgi:hypothetical protein